MHQKKNIALVAHDNCKKALTEWVEWSFKLLLGHALVCTGTTGKLVHEMTASDSSVSASGTLKPSPSTFCSNRAVPDFSECGLPYGLHGSLGTLRLIRSAAGLSTALPW